MSVVPKGLRGHYPAVAEADRPQPTHVHVDALGEMVPIMSNSPAQWVAATGMILRCLAGSGVHGMAIEGTDDRDEMGVFTEPPEYVIGSKMIKHYQFRTQPEGVCSGPGDLDLICYTLRRYVGLAAQGNPTALLPLFVPDSEVCFINDFGRELRANRHLFLSRQAGPRFRGYLESQRRGLMGLRSGGTRNQGRKDIRDRLGFDAKFAAHMVRLGIQGAELLATGTITLPMPADSLTYLRGLKSGDYLDGAEPGSQQWRARADEAKADALARAERLERVIDGLLVDSPLPERPDWDAINGWLMSVHRRRWGW